MTRPTRWPKNAEAARCESLAAARDIVSLGRAAKKAITEGKRELALAHISEMQLAAKDIVVAMRLAKTGELEGGS